MKKLQPILIAIIVTMLVVPWGGTFSVNAQDRLTVIASHNILADVVQNVAGDAADVSSLIPLGADPHTFAPTPREIAQLTEADVIFINGAFFEEGLLETIENAGSDLPLVTASQCVEILAFGGHHDGEDHDDDEDHEDEDREDEDDHQAGDSEVARQCEAHDDTIDNLYGANADLEAQWDDIGYLYALDCEIGHDNEEDEDAADEEHGHGACDPHVWMNPQNVAFWTLTIRDTLIAADPANEALYTANAAAYLQALYNLHIETLMPLVEQISTENRILVTNHEAFGYFAAAFGFEIVGTIIPGGGTDAEPSAQDVAALIEEIQATGVPAIFTENTVSDRLAAQIAAESGAQVYQLYSGSLSDGDPASTYIDYMIYNVQTIVEGLR